ncbi:MAG: serine hydrolase [Bacteroidota bacterium]
MSARKLLLPFLFLITQFVFSQTPLEQIIQKDTFLNRIAQNPAHQVQIIYTQVNRDDRGQASFKSFEFGVDTNLYFYPASTVKLPTALLALEKINQLGIENLDKNARMLTGAERAPQTPVFSDTSAQNLQPSIAHYIKKILLVSDNDAYNRLYEFLGQKALNDKLHEKGYTSTRIIHRLSVSGYDSIGNRYTNPVRFEDPQGNLLYYQGQGFSRSYQKGALKQQVRGKGYQSGGEIINEAFDFRYKNYISLQDLHDVVKAVIFPQSIPAHQRFDLTEEDYDFVKKYMSMLPRQSDYPAYPKLKEWDDYVKFLVFGSAKNTIPEHIKIYNKVGDAYGFLTDVAYIVDEKSGVEFLLAANVHVNANEIFNDGVYEYDALGFPFLGRLGEVILEYERGRK